MRSSKPHLTFSLVTRNCKIRFWNMWLPKYPDIRNQQCESVMSIWCSITWQLYNQQQEHSYSMRCPRVSIFIAEWREQPTNICRIHKLYNDRTFWSIQIPQHSGHQNCHRASDNLKTHKLMKTTFIMYKIVKVIFGTHPLAFPNRWGLVAFLCTGRWNKEACPFSYPSQLALRTEGE